MRTLAIIGFGRFGKLATKFLKKDFEVFVADKVNRKKEADALRVKFVPLKEAALKNIIILAVPISEMKNVLLKIKPHLKKNTIILDTCSVKEYPLDLMKKILPKSVKIIGTHPMFGPDSIKGNSLKGKKIVLCGKNKVITKYLKSKGLDVILTTPVKHDKEIAQTLCFTHFIGRALSNMNIKERRIDTLCYKRLLKILDTVDNDTMQLFCDMHKYNRFTKKIREKFIRSLIRINDNLK